MPDITVTLRPSEAIHAAHALETQIDKIAKFCRDKDSEFGDMNNLHKSVMRGLLSCRDELVKELRAAGWKMANMTDYDITLPEWQDIS